MEEKKVVEMVQLTLTVSELEVLMLAFAHAVKPTMLSEVSFAVAMTRLGQPGYSALHGKLGKLYAGAKGKTLEEMAKQAENNPHIQKLKEFDL